MSASNPARDHQPLDLANQLADAPPEEFSAVESGFFQTGEEEEKAQEKKQAQALIDTDAMLDAAEAPVRRRRSLTTPERLALLSTLAAVIAVIAGLSL